MGLEEISEEEPGEERTQQAQGTLERKGYQKIVPSLAGDKPEGEPLPQPEHTFKRKMDPGQMLWSRWGELAKQEVSVSHRCVICSCIFCLSLSKSV